MWLVTAWQRSSSPSGKENSRKPPTRSWRRPRRAARSDRRRGLLDQRHCGFVHTVSFHGGDLELQALVAHAVPDFRRSAEQREYQPADAVDLLVLQLEVEQGPCFVNSHGP